MDRQPGSRYPTAPDRFDDGEDLFLCDPDAEVPSLQDEAHPAQSMIAGCYLGFAMVFVSGFTPFAALLVLYLVRGECRGTWLESHCGWLIDTFWVAFKVTLAMAAATLLLGSLLGTLAVWFFWLGYAALGLWFGWRLWFGWSLFRGDAPVSEPGLRR